MDPHVWDTCVGGSEGGKRNVGEGSCSTKTGVCQNPETEGTTGPIACPSNSFISGQLCEYADGACMPQGIRPVLLNGHPARETSPVNFCQDSRFQNGDLDFDGIVYQKGKWPNGSKNVPTSARYAGPFDQAGNAYPRIQFETDAAGSEFLCNIFTGLNCVAPPLAAHFYPYWTMTNKPGQGIGRLFRAPACIWNFGDFIPGVTTQAFGGDAQYGVPNIARFGGTIITPKPIANPEVTGNCPVLHNPVAGG